MSRHVQGANLRGTGFSGLVLGLVVAAWVKGEVSEEFTGLGCDDSDVEVGDEEGYGGVFVGSTPWSAQVWLKVSTTIGPVIRRWTVTDSA